MKARPKTQPKTRISLTAIVWRIFKMVIKACPIYFTATCLIGVIHGLSWGLNTYATQFFFDAVATAVTSQTELTMVYLGLLALGGVTVGSQVLNGVHNFMAGALYGLVPGHLVKHIHRKAARIEPICYESPDLLDDINKAEKGAGSSLGLLIVVVVLLTFYLPYFVFMGWYLYRLKPILLLSLVFIFIPVFITQLIRGAVHARLEDESAPLRREVDYYERCICDREYFKETRLLGAYRFFRDLYLTALKAMQQKKWNVELKTNLMEIGMRMLTLAGYFGVLYLLFTALMNGEISIGSFAAVFGSIELMFGIMEEIVANHIGGMTRDLATVRNFIRFLDLPERSGDTERVSFDGGIKFTDVSFAYPGSETKALDHVNLTIRPGETIAIVGQNGAGKSTLVKLLTGLYLPTEGTVEIGGVDSRRISPESIYKGITGVFQKYQRYKLTLQENVQISDLQAQDENHLDAAVAKADLELDQETFPQGYETMLSREFDGVDLSGGQWQRVALARGFYRVHDLIVLDEPTAAIDPIEETRIYHKFAELSKEKTAIIVTHRLGSAKIADRIVVMDQGRIVAVGTHEQLMQEQGKYAEMYQAQAQWYAG